MTNLIHFDASCIDTVIFDVDGTWYRKDVEYTPGRGSIQTSHDFFRFLAYQMLAQDKTRPSEVPEKLVQEYHERVKQGTLQNAIDKVAKPAKQRYLSLVADHGSNGKVFVNEFGTDSSFLHNMLGFIDFESILSEDRAFQETVSYLKQRDLNLGVLTTEVYETVRKVASALGIDLDDFSMNTGDKYRILCAENVQDKKPSPEGFKRIKSIYPGDPRSIAYVGDHPRKDVETSLINGIQAIHIDHSASNPVELDTVELDGKPHQYARINSLTSLRTLLPQ